MTWLSLSPRVALGQVWGVVGVQLGTGQGRGAKVGHISGAKYEMTKTGWAL